MDPYKVMLSAPEFALGEDLTEKLMTYVDESTELEGVFERQEALYIVEGLAIAYSGLMNLRVDIPNYGRTTAGNPMPAVEYAIATPDGYVTDQIPLSTGW